MFRSLPAVMMLALVSLAACGSESAVSIPAPTLDPAVPGPGTKTAVLAGGCFWGVQGVFQHLRGVKNVLSGHAESVQIVYDPTQVSYGQILQVFFAVAHDPTELNRQGPDFGPQYRSAIF